MNLKNLTSETLLNNTKNLVARERELLLEVLNHLKEIDCRKLFLELGYPSLWAYCTKDLGYTEAAVAIKCGKSSISRAKSKPIGKDHCD